MYRIMAHSRSPYSRAPFAYLKDVDGNVKEFASEQERDAELERLNRETRSPFVWYTR